MHVSLHICIYIYMHIYICIIAITIGEVRGGLGPRSSDYHVYHHCTYILLIHTDYKLHIHYMYIYIYTYDTYILQIVYYTLLQYSIIYYTYYY